VTTLRIATRGSTLALVQARLVEAALLRLGVAAELVPVVSAGDVRAPGTTPGEGVFVTALEAALLAGEADLAVHSAKDMPLVAEPDLVVAAYPERADPRDALIGGSLAGAAPGARVGTDSLRRAGFLLRLRPDLRHQPLHGNVDTRLRKLDAGETDLLVLAAAGLDRLGLSGRIAARFSPQEVTPAGGQGALAVQARRSDRRVRGLLAALDRPDIRLAVDAERAVLEATGGTCRSPVGALARVAGESVELLAAAVMPDGTHHHLVVLSGALGEAPGLAARAGRELLERVPLGSVGSEPGL
jgi:hydroxymethylbilane synthase